MDVLRVQTVENLHHAATVPKKIIGRYRHFHFEPALSLLVRGASVVTMLSLTAACGLIVNGENGKSKLNTALIHIKDEKKGALAKEAETAWGELQFTELMKKARSNMKAHVDLNIKVIAESETLRRQRLIKNIMYAKWTARDAFGINYTKSGNVRYKNSWQTRRNSILQKSNKNDLGAADFDINTFQKSWTKNVDVPAKNIKKNYRWTPPMCLSPSYPGTVLPASAIKVLKSNVVPDAIWTVLMESSPTSPDTANAELLKLPAKKLKDIRIKLIKSLGMQLNRMPADIRTLYVNRDLKAGDLEHFSERRKKQINRIATRTNQAMLILRQMNDVSLRLDALNGEDIFSIAKERSDQEQQSLVAAYNDTATKILVTLVKDYGDRQAGIKTAYAAYVDSCRQSLVSFEGLAANSWPDLDKNCKKFNPVHIATNPGNSDSIISDTSLHGAVWVALCVRRALADLLEKVKDVRKPYDDALKELKELTEAAAKTADPEAKKRFDKYLEKVNDAKSTLSAINIFAAKDVFKERLAAVDTLLNALGKGEVDAEAVKNDPELKKAALVAATIGKLIDVLPGLQARTNAPDISALLIQRDIAKAELDLAEAQVSLTLRAIDLADDLFKGVQREIVMLTFTRNELCEAFEIDTYSTELAETCGSASVNTNKDHALIDALETHSLDVSLAKYLTDNSNNDDAQKFMYSAIAQMAATGTDARALQMAARLRLIALGPEGVLLENEKALRKWNAVIETPLKQLATYHAAGVTEAQLTSLISNFLQLGVTGSILGTVQ